MSDFISENGMWLIIFAILFVMAIIGYIADKKKKEQQGSKKKEEKESTVKAVEKPKEVKKEEVKKEVVPVIEKKEDTDSPKEAVVKTENKPLEMNLEPAIDDKVVPVPSNPEEKEEVTISIDNQVPIVETVESVPEVVEETSTQDTTSIQEPKEETFSIPTIEESLTSDENIYHTDLFSTEPSTESVVDASLKEVMSTPTTDDIDLSSFMQTPTNYEEVPATITDRGEDLTVPLGDMPVQKEEVTSDSSLGMNDLSAFQIGDKIDQAITSTSDERNLP